MDATIEEFGKLYPSYATLYFKDECEIVETAPKSGLDFRRLVVSGGEGYAFPRELAGDSVSFIVRLVVRNPCFSIVMVSSLRRLMVGNACLFAN